jgi:3',5'-cyclic-AMP phosphodiesterase
MSSFLSAIFEIFTPFATHPVAEAVTLPPVPAAPFLLLQITDSHIGAQWDGQDPVAGLASVVDAVRRLPDPPDAVVLTGDLTEHGATGEYASVREITSAIPAPLHVLPGNHDDRAAIRAAFNLPGAADEPVRYAVDLGPLRLVAVDTIIPGHDGGSLDGELLEWLEAELGRASERPTLLAMHHPPVATGIAAWDAIGLPPADRAALGRVLERHPQVRRVVAGHVHQTIVAQLAGRPVLTIPSTYLQARLDFTATLALEPGPRGYALHALVDGEIASYVRTL